MFYFRVIRDGEPELFSRSFRRADDGDPQPDDFVISVSPRHFSQIMAARPTALYVRVYHDRHDHDLANGAIYDENLARVRPGEIKGNPALLTITPDEFQAALATRGGN